MPGLPVARALVDTAGPHNDVLLTGSPNVLVENFPLHRALDMHICPIIGIGITLLGTQLVLVNGLPAARIGSLGQCLTPNYVITGSPKVLVGG